MSRKLLILTFLLVVSILSAQTEGDNINVLTAPSSPASNLLGIAESDVEKPTDVTDFMISLQEATSSLTSLPASYAIDFAPFLAFSTEPNELRITKNSVRKQEAAKSAKETFIISLAVRNTDEEEVILNPESVYGAAGFKISLKRGRIDNQAKQKLQIIKNFQTQKIQLQNKAGLTADELVNLNAYRSAIKEAASEVIVSRVGFTLDLAGGISSEFKEKNIGKAKLNNAGLWTTAGYSTEKYGAFLFLLRYLYSPDKIFAIDDAVSEISDISTLDGGCRYIFGKPQSRFNLSGEFIYRSVISKSDIDPTYRLALVADYTLKNNQKIGITFGRNYDGTVTKGGNLIAALTFVAGLGSKKTLN